MQQTVLHKEPDLVLVTRSYNQERVQSYQMPSSHLHIQALNLMYSTSYKQLRVFYRRCYLPLNPVSYNLERHTKQRKNHLLQSLHKVCYKSVEYHPVMLRTYQDAILYKFCLLQDMHFVTTKKIIHNTCKCQRSL